MAQGARGQACRTHASMQDAHKHAGRTSACVVRDGTGRTRACRTHTRGVPTMDGCWMRGDILRVKAAGALPVVLVSERGRSNTEHPSALTRQARVVFTRNVCK